MPLRTDRFYNNTRSATYWLSLLIGASLCAAIGARIPISHPMPGYWVDALLIAKGWHLHQHFTPAGYPVVIGLAMRLQPSHAAACLLIVQSLIHIGTMLVMWVILRMLGCGPGSALLTTLLFQLHPELLTSISKVWDVPLSAALFLSIFASMLFLHRQPRSMIAPCIAGAAFGAGILERPNFVLLLPLILLVFYLRRDPPTPRRPVLWSLAQTLLLVFTAALVYLGGAEVAYGHFDTPHNGPYNLYAGQNSFTAATLQHNLNAEQSILPSLRSIGIFMNDGDIQTDAVAPLFVSLSSRFAEHHPGEELRLVGIKLFTVLRPDTKVHRLASTSGFVKALEALPFPLWTITVVLTFGLRRLRLDLNDALLFSAVVLYLIPFLTTNSDPRFRLPLDLLVMIHLVSIGKRYKNGGHAAATTNSDSEPYDAKTL